MTPLQALHNFWSGFGIKAYDVYTIPDDAKLPYITYEASNDFFGSDLMQSVSLWYRSTSWADITAKEHEIAQYIGRGGVMVPCDGGAIWIKREQPWAQRMDDPSDNMIRRIVLNIQTEYLT